MAGLEESLVRVLMFGFVVMIAHTILITPWKYKNFGIKNILNLIVKVIRYFGFLLV
jgi:hypothetical protein